MQTKREFWNEVYKAADVAGFHQFTMSAEEDANALVFNGEFEVETQEYADYCIRHLETLLSYTDDAKAVAFFTDLGVRF